MALANTLELGVSTVVLRRSRMRKKRIISGKIHCLTWVCVVTAIGIAAYCLFVQDTSINTALGSGLSVMVLDGWRSLFAGRPNKMGFDRNGETLVHLTTLGHAISAYALLTNQEWATEFVTYWGYFGLLNGVFGIFNPSKWMTIWGQDEKPAKDTLVGLFNRSAAFSMSAYATLCLCLFNDVDRYKAFAYACAIFGAHFISANYIVDEVGELEMNKALFNFWIVYFAVLVASLLL
jgi:hypothetical protein